MSIGTDCGADGAFTCLSRNWSAVVRNSKAAVWPIVSRSAKVSKKVVCSFSVIACKKNRAYKQAARVLRLFKARPKYGPEMSPVTLYRLPRPCTLALTFNALIACSEQSIAITLKPRNPKLQKRLSLQLSQPTSSNKLSHAIYCAMKAA